MYNGQLVQVNSYCHERARFFSRYPDVGVFIN